MPDDISILNKEQIKKRCDKYLNNRTKFEYKIEVLDLKSDAIFEDELNELGKEGWELVQFHFVGGTYIKKCVFKRQKT